MSQVPAVGRVVHYVSYDTPGGEYPMACRAAVITEVVPQFGEEDEGAGDSTVALCVLNPTGQSFNRMVPFDPGGRPHDSEDGLPLCRDLHYQGGTWHWPEIVIVKPEELVRAALRDEAVQGVAAAFEVPPSLLGKPEDAGPSKPVVVDPQTGEAQDLADWVNQPTRQEQEAAELRRSTTQTLAFDLWCALGCGQLYFQDYVDRNGLNETWAGLVRTVQLVRGVEVCGLRVEDAAGGEAEFCVLLEHSPEHPCYGPSDVGRSEPIQWKDLRS